MEESDIMHELELSDLTWGERHKWSMRLTEILKERRIAKNEIQLLKPIYKFI